MEYLHQFVVTDGELSKNTELKPAGKTIIYEVIRVVNGIPVFFEKHLQRLKNSANLLNKAIPFSVWEFKELTNKLMAANKVFTGNIKISLIYQETAIAEHTVIGYIPHKYPEPADYIKGVKTVSSRNARLNPQVKAQNEKLRDQLNKLIQEESAYEAILVHPDGYVTEGSRSNIFFIKGKQIFTAPDHLVLSGITRENVIEICRNNNYEVIFSPVNYQELGKTDGAFITGTSPKVLPIRSIDAYNFNLPHPIIDDLLKKYNDLIDSYIKLHTS